MFDMVLQHETAHHEITASSEEDLQSDLIAGSHAHQQLERNVLESVHNTREYVLSCAKVATLLCPSCASDSQNLS